MHGSLLKFPVLATANGLLPDFSPKLLSSVVRCKDRVCGYLHKASELLYIVCLAKGRSVNNFSKQFIHFRRGSFYWNNTPNTTK